MAEEYKVLIGAELSKDDFAKAEGKIQAFTNKARPPIEIGVKLSDNAQNVIDNLKRDLNELNRDGININGSIGINSADVGRITKSFESLRVTLDGIHKSLGSLDDSTDAKSILTTINRIGNAFDGLQRDIESLAGSLKSLDGLKLNLDLGSLLGTNSKNSMANNLLYGSKAKRFVIPKLQEYIQQIKNEFENAGIGDNLFESSFKRIVDSDGGIRLVRNDLTDEMRKELGKVKPIYEEAMSYMRNFNSLSAVDKMTGLENYIKALRGIADIRGVDLSRISSDLDSISKSITDTINIAAGVVDTDEASKKLSKIFGGIDADGMKSALEPLKQSIDGIIGKLSELEGSFSQSLGSGMNVSGLNETLTNINTTLIKIDNSLNGLGGQVQLQELSKSFSDLANAIHQASNACIGIESAMTGGSQAVSQMDNIVIQTRSHAQALVEAMRAFGIDQSEIDEATQKLRDLNITVTDVVETLRTGKNLDFKIKGIDQYGRDVSANLAYRMKKRKGKGLQPEMSLTTSIHEKVGNVVKPIDEVTDAYQRMIELRRTMTEMTKKQIGKDPHLDAEYIREANKAYIEAEAEYQALESKYQSKFNKKQKRKLSTLEEDGKRSIKLKSEEEKTKKAKQDIADRFKKDEADEKASIKDTESVYKRMIDLRKKMTQSQKDKFGKDSVFDKEIIDKANHEYAQAFKEFLDLQSKYGSKLSKEQKRGLVDAWKQGRSEINDLENQEKSNKRKKSAKEDAVETQKAYQTMLKARKKMADARIASIGKDPILNKNDLDKAESDFNDAFKEYQNLAKKYAGKFNDEQKKGLTAEHQAQRKREKGAEGHQKDKEYQDQVKRDAEAIEAREEARKKAEKAAADNTKRDYQNMLKARQKMADAKIAQIGKDPILNKNDIDAAIKDYNNALKEYQDLAKKNRGKFTQDQKKWLADEVKAQAKRVQDAEGHQKDLDYQKRIKEEANDTKAAFEKMLKLRQKMADAEKVIAKTDSDAEKIYQTDIWTEALDDYDKLWKKYKSKLTGKQRSELYDIKLQSDKDIDLIKDKKAEDQLEEVKKKLQKKAEEIADIEIKLDNLKLNDGLDADIEKCTNDLKELIAEYEKLYKIVNGSVASGAKIELPADIEKRINEGKAYSKKVKDEDLKKQADDIRKNATDNSLAKEEASITKSLGNIVEKTQAVKNAVDEYNSALANLKKVRDNSASTDQEMISAQERYEAALKSANNALKTQSDLESAANARKRDANAAKKLEIDKRAFESGMDVWLNKNSEAADYFADKIANIRQRLKECDATELTQLRTEFTDLKRQAELAGKTVKSFGDRLSDQFKRFGTYFALDNIIDEAVQGIRDMYDQVVQIDTAMTDLYKVTDETPERYEQFLGSAQKGAKELGRSVSSYITQSAKWAQMGYGIGDSEQLAKISSIYSNVADVTDETAVGDIVATLKAFDLATSDAITIVDSLNKLGKLMPMRNYIG